MAVLEKIRVRMGIFITVIIGVALISFIVDAQTLQSAISLFTSKYDVGEMNGKAISYQDYQNKIDYFTRLQQMITGQASLDERGQEMVNESAWQDMLGEYVLLPAIDKAGFKVGEDELLDLTQGNSISPILMREQVFMGEDGIFSRDKLVDFVRAIPGDASGNLALYWNYLEKSIKNDQMFTKYISLLDKSTFNSPLELKRMIAENNTSSDISFIIQPYGFISDTTITVTQQEIKNYYNKNKERFDLPASRDVDYVVFEVVPSEEDITLAQNDIEKVYEEFSTTTNLKSFLARNSERQLSDYFFKEGELSSISTELDNFAFTSSTKDILPIYKDENIFRAARINSIKHLPDSVFVEHILLDNRDNLLAKSIADSLTLLLNRGVSFSEIAAENSLDKNPNMAPGELGWMTQLMKIPGFDTCFNAPLNKLIRDETEYGLHIVRTTKKTASYKKVQLAILEKSAVAGKQTFQEYYSRANTIASKSDGKIEKFREVVKESEVPVLPAIGVEEGSKSFATYKDARAITRWIYDAKVGDVSQIISLDNKYFFVVAVTGAREKGIQSLDAVKDNIKTAILMDKTNDKLVKSIEEKVAGISDLETIAEILGTTVSRESGISFGSPGAQAMDPAFVGAISSAPLKQVKGPIKGSVGVYMFEVEDREVGEFFTQSDAKIRSSQIFSYKLQLLQDILTKGAGVKDYRFRFF